MSVFAFKYPQKEFLLFSSEMSFFRPKFFIMITSLLSTWTVRPSLCPLLFPIPAAPDLPYLSP